MKEKFICPLCQELYGKEVPMQEGIGEERVKEGLKWKKYIIIQGGLVCKANSLHFIDKATYLQFQQGKISRERILAQMKDLRDAHLTSRLQELFARKKSR